MRVMPGEAGELARFARRLDGWLEGHGKSGAWLADEMGVGQSTVNQWRHGTRWPQFAATRLLII